MKYEPLGASRAAETLDAEYKQAYEAGKLRLGGSCLFFRQGLKVFYIPYTDVRRYFRRVMQVPARLCCGRGNFDIESLVICGDAGELAQIQLPGTRAAKVVMEKLSHLIPDAAVGPDRAKAGESAGTKAGESAGETAVKEESL